MSFSSGEPLFLSFTDLKYITVYSTVPQKMMMIFHHSLDIHKDPVTADV